MKRAFCILCSVLLIVILSAGGLLVILKAHSMYRNIWDMLDRLYTATQVNATNIDDISYDLNSVRTQVERFYNQTFHSDNSESRYDYSWVDKVPPYIAHARGGIDGVTYTNSREAFIHNYEAGQRVFEIDFNLSADGILIASHDENTWRSLSGSTLAYTEQNFSASLLLNSYESLTIDEIIELLSLYPDAYLVTDTKDTSKTNVMLAFSQIVHHAEQTHPEVLERIIPQIYHEDMLSWISSIYPFRSVILTLYQLEWTPESVLDFCINSGVRFVTLSFDRITEDILRLWDSLDICSAVHTVNDTEAANAFLDMGVDMIYTDFITPYSTSVLVH